MFSPSVITSMVKPSGKVLPLPAFACLQIWYCFGAAVRVRDSTARCAVFSRSSSHLALFCSILTKTRASGFHLPLTFHRSSDESDDQRGGVVSWKFSARLYPGLA